MTWKISILCSIYNLLGILGNFFVVWLLWWLRMHDLVGGMILELLKFFYLFQYLFLSLAENLLFFRLQNAITQWMVEFESSWSFFYDLCSDSQFHTDEDGPFLVHIFVHLSTANFICEYCKRSNSSIFDVPIWWFHVWTALWWNFALPCVMWFVNKPREVAMKTLYSIKIPLTSSGSN